MVPGVAVPAASDAMAMAATETPVATQAVPAVQVRRAAMDYGGGEPALVDVDLVLEEGEFLSIVGPSGCGKSTLLKLISGLERSSAGEILVRGRRVT